MSSDFDLLDAWADGDLKAGNRLFDIHYDSVFRFFRNKISTGAEDLVQETFLAAVKGRDRFRRESSFRTYLFATARNVLYAEYRKRKRKDGPVDFTNTSMMDLEPSPTAVLAKKAEERILLEALRTIPMDYQVCLELYLWENLTGPELAEILELGEPGVRSRLRRSKEALRKRIEEIEGGAKLDSTASDLDGWAASLREMLAEKAAE